MPPLAHLLAPQVMRRVEEIQQAQNPPTQGYLAQAPLKSTGGNVGYSEKELDKSWNAPDLKASREQRDKMYPDEARRRAQLQGAYDKDKRFVPEYAARVDNHALAQKGYLGKALAQQQRRDPNYADKSAKEWKPQLIPSTGGQSMGQGVNAPGTVLSAPITHARRPAIIGQDERGNPIYATAGGPQLPTRRGPIILKASDLEGATNEYGDEVNARGKRVGGQPGYLSAPALVTRDGRKIDMRDANRGTGRYARGAEGPDIHLLKAKGSDDKGPNDDRLPAWDKAGYDAMQGAFAKHVKEKRDNGGEFPEGYFDGMSAKEKNTIRKAMWVLEQADKQRVTREGASLSPFEKGVAM